VRVSPLNLPRSNGLIRFGAFELDLRARELRKDGRSTGLPEQSIMVLDMLLGRPGELILREEIRSRLWPNDTVVEFDHSINTAIRKLRLALGESADNPQYIETLARRGYRWIGAAEVLEVQEPQVGLPIPPAVRDASRPSIVTELLEGGTLREITDSVRLIERPSDSTSQAATHPAVVPPTWLPSEPHLARPRIGRLAVTIVVVAALGTVLGYFAVQHVLVPDRHANVEGDTAPPSAVSNSSVAVLPFLDLSEKRDQEYFADGMSEELIDVLSQVPELHVPARTSSFYFKGKPVTVSDIARTLGVAHVLEGSIRKSGDNLRITAQLIRVDTGYHLWSASYDRRLDDIFAIQKEIAAAVRQALSVSLLIGQPPKMVGTQDTEAYDLLLRARSLYFHSGRKEDWGTIVTYLKQALHRDSRFASAWALLSKAQEKLGDYDNPIQERHQLEEDARRSARQALALDNILPEAHVAMANVCVLDMNWGGALKEAQEALSLDPGNAFTIYYLGTVLVITGQLDRSLALLEKSIASDPLNPHAYNNLGLVRYAAGMYPAAQIAFRKSLDLNPQEQEIHWSMGANLLMSSRAVDALEEFDLENGERLRLQGRALAFHALGRREEADAALNSLENKYGDRAPYAIAQVRALRSEADQAIAALERAYTIRDGSIWTIKIDPLLNNIRSDQRFTALLRKMHLAE
jgi:TolB-like protein/DNA-binding winged helix-turn-helix (wHTH) protein/tetratricopeptide (TPR) repeat protein